MFVIVIVVVVVGSFDMFILKFCNLRFGVNSQKNNYNKFFINSVFVRVISLLYPILSSSSICYCKK
jgi:hypothetical protein